jgi:hypothetical protein
MRRYLEIKYSNPDLTPFYWPYICTPFPDPHVILTCTRIIQVFTNTQFILVSPSQWLFKFVCALISAATVTLHSAQAFRNSRNAYSNQNLFIINAHTTRAFAERSPFTNQSIVRNTLELLNTLFDSLNAFGQLFDLDLFECNRERCGWI